MALNDTFAWQKDAACIEYPDLDMFPSESDRKGVAKAKVVCKKCLVKDDCLEYAYKNKVVDGIWGGFTFSERKKVGPLINLKKQLMKDPTTPVSVNLKAVSTSPKPFVLRVP